MNEKEKIGARLTLKGALALRMDRAWREAAGEVWCEGTRITPSYDNLADLSALLLRAAGVDPDQVAQSMAGLEEVSVVEAINRQEADTQRLGPAVALWAIGVRNRIERLAAFRLKFFEHRAAVHFYRHRATIAAAVFYEQAHGVDARAFAVYFVAHEAEQIAGACWNPAFAAWLIGWEKRVVEPRRTQPQERKFQRTLAGLLQRILGRAPAAPLQGPAHPPRGGNQ